MPALTVRHRRLNGLFTWVLTLVAAAGVAVAIRAFVAQSFSVPSGSMLPTLQIGDRLVVNKLISTIHRGDIVVFHRVPADNDPSIAFLVKRVIGLPGETISSRGETILINGQPIAQSWLPKLTGQCAETAANIHPTKIATGHYFMMGDCRGISDDSRTWGTVPRSFVVGKVVAVVWRHGHPFLHWF